MRDMIPSGAAIGTSSRLAWGWCVLLAGLTVLSSGCAANASAPAVPASVERRGPVAITIALPGDPTALGGSMTSGVAVVPSRYFREFPNAYLTTHDARDVPVPWLAAQMPSLDD